MPVVLVMASITLTLFVGMLFEKNRNLVHVFAPVILMAFMLVGGKKLYESDYLLPQWNFSSSTEWRHRGMAFYKKGRFAEAEKAYRQSLSIRENSITRGNLANALKAQGKLDEALQNYHEALKQNPMDHVVLYNLGNLYRDHRHDFAAAIRH
jgi:tetratricopeptide (TPR) repeat protein